MPRMSFLGTRLNGVETLSFSQGARRLDYRIEPDGSQFLAHGNGHYLGWGTRKECFAMIRNEASITMARISLHR